MPKGKSEINHGALGDGKTNSIKSPKQIVASGVTAIAAGWWHSLFLKSDGSLWAMGENDYGQLGDGTTNNINRPAQIVAGPPVTNPAGAGGVLVLTNTPSKPTNNFWRIRSVP